MRQIIFIFLCFTGFVYGDVLNMVTDMRLYQEHNLSNLFSPQNQKFVDILSMKRVVKAEKYFDVNKGRLYWVKFSIKKPQTIP